MGLLSRCIRQRSAPRLAGLWCKQPPRARVLALLLPSAFLLGCGPTLQAEEVFTPKKVQAIQFADQCSLQAYFDQQPPLPRRESENTLSAEKKALQVGRITFRLDHEVQRVTLYRLLDAYYQGLPAFDRRQELHVTVSYYQKGPQRLIMPIGAEIVLIIQDQETTLPYHPCMDAFFFGQHYFQLRRQLIKQAAFNQRQPATDR